MKDGRCSESRICRRAQAIASSNRAVSDVAAEYWVSWRTAHQALVAAAARWLPEPEPTSRLGIDETRFGSVRWILDGITWKRSDPWLTSFVDCSGDAGSLLGLAPGRTGGCVRDWLAEQTEAFRNAIEIVVIDPSAPYASGIRAALPNTLIAVDKWHLVALANRVSATGDRRPPALDGVRQPCGLGDGRIDCCLVEVGQPRADPRRFPLGQQHPEPFLDTPSHADLLGRIAAVQHRFEPPPGVGDGAAAAQPIPSDPLPDLGDHLRGVQRPHRRVQPDYQADQGGWLRLPEHDQLPAPYPQPYCGHPAAKRSSTTGSNPAQVRRAGYPRCDGLGSRPQKLHRPRYRGPLKSDQLSWCALARRRSSTGTGRSASKAIAAR